MKGIKIYPEDFSTKESDTGSEKIFKYKKQTYRATKNDVQIALAAGNRGDDKRSFKLFESHANKGDVISIVTIGQYYHTGDTVEQDYLKAAEWYAKAVKYFDGDALNNLGVLFRDGLGVKQNLKIAYDLFWIVHFRCLGSESTQLRVGRNISKTKVHITQGEINEAIEYTEIYVLSYAVSLGRINKSIDLLKNKTGCHTTNNMNEINYP